MWLYPDCVGMESDKKDFTSEKKAIKIIFESGDHRSIYATVVSDDEDIVLEEVHNQTANPSRKIEFKA